MIENGTAIKTDSISSNLNSDGPIARLYSLFLMVVRSMLSFRLQHVLTLLTMAIGSMALSATLFVGEGALLGLWNDLDRLMGNKVIVSPDGGPDQQLLKKRLTPDLTAEDLEYVKSQLADVRYVAPRYFGKAHVFYLNKYRYLSVDGISFEQHCDQAFQPIKGRGFSDASRDGFIFECLLTESAGEYFNIDIDQQPTIRIDAYRYHVVGIVPDPPEADKRFQARVVIPFFAAQLQWGKPGIVDNIVVAWNGPQKMESTIKALSDSLDECRETGAYHLSSSEFKVRKRKGIVSNFIAFGSAQSLFCILVATIGVINVMLANVVRRAREFAIRVAMGAKQKDIVILVLAESFMLGFLGASIGIIAAALLAPPLCNIISSRIPEASTLTPLIGAKGVLIPLFVCSLSGLFAGIIPALRAGKLDILSVLRAD